MPSHTRQQFSFIPETIKGLVKICLYNELTQKTSTDDQITGLEVSLRDNELRPPCENTQPSPGTQLVQWRVTVTVTVPLCTPPLFFFHQQSFSRGRKVIFFNSSKRIHAVQLVCKKDYDCGLERKRVTVVFCCLFNNPSCHGNCRADEKCYMTPGAVSDKINY